MKTRSIRLIAAIGAVAVLGGCASSGDVQQVRAPLPSPTPYAQAPAPQVQQAQPREQVQAEAAIAGTAFPNDGTAGRVPNGSRLVVRVYDAAGGDVNVRAAEGAYKLRGGLPARYELPVPVSALQDMELPAVAARVETAKGGVLYRNETAVLLKNGAPGDIPMTRQSRQAASVATKEWK